MTKGIYTPSRRQALNLIGTGAASLALPGRVFGQSEKNVKILLASGAPLLAWSVSFLAEALGYFKEEGLNVEWIPTASGPASMTALVAGSGHVNYSAPAEALSAIVRGQKFKALMALSNYNAIYLLISKEYAAKHGITADTPLEKRIAAAGNFKGFRMGVTAAGSTVDAVARMALKQVGLNPDVDAQIVAMGTTTNSMAAMSQGRLDGFVATPPTPEITVSQFGAIPLFSVGKDEIRGVKVLIGHIVEARASDVEQSPDLFAALVRANVRAFRYLLENKQEAGNIVYKSRYTSMVSTDVWPAVWNNNLSQFRTPYISKESIESWVTLGMVPGATDPKAIGTDDFIDMRFVDQATQKIGWKAPT